MKKRLIECFEEQHTFYLIEANYKKLDIQVLDQKLNLVCNDSLTASIIGDVYRINFKRTVEFNPKSMYLINVELGADLKIKEGKREEVLASKDELLNGLLDNNAAVISNLVSRSSFIVSSLTASFGQQPVITPPSVLGKED